MPVLSRNVIKRAVLPGGLISIILIILVSCHEGQVKGRLVQSFNKHWQFVLGPPEGSLPEEGAAWRTLNLPHDWSIEGNFSPAHPATPAGGALPGGIGWYRKTFQVPASWRNKKVWVEFDGVYRHCEVWLNGHYVGRWPYGYSSFRFEIGEFLKFAPEANVILVKVDNSKQPNSRWYSGSGIYRNVRLVATEPVYIEPWGIFVTTPEVTEKMALVRQQTTIHNATKRAQEIRVRVDIIDHKNRIVGREEISRSFKSGDVDTVTVDLRIDQPQLWSIDRPSLYKTRTRVFIGKIVWDEAVTPFGIRYFVFDPVKGFLLNGQQVKINGVCNHHDLGCLGAAVYPRAIERQLRLLKEMGCNAIRTAHNPPAPELLDLCDQMGFLVMDEAFDMWKKGKTKYDYSLDWEEWHEQDLRSMVLRDRNHPSIVIWSIGNEVLEQWDQNEGSGIVIAQKLAGLVKQLDPTRPVTAACNNTSPENPLIRSGALDLIGYNYSHEKYKDIPETYPGKPFIATETVSALATRGHYDMPSEQIRRWPLRWDQPFTMGNPDHTCSSYDNCSAPWGSTHRETWQVVKSYDFISGMFVWTGFDYLGEPTPYDWPSRSSYFGILDLAGFAKDAYYFYQSQWTSKPVLHIFPHWNWKEGDTVDIWAYTNCHEVELFVNGESAGVQKKGKNDLRLQWRVRYVPGSITAKGKHQSGEVLVKTIWTAGQPARLQLEADRTALKADGIDLAFLTIRVLDKNGVLVPGANNLIKVIINGESDLIGMDNGCQTSLESFQANPRSAFNGLCLAVIRARESSGKITVRVESPGLEPAEVKLQAVSAN